MNDFKKRGGFGGGRGGDRGNGGFAPRRDFGGRPSFGGDRGGFGGRPMELHQAICADCGKSCEVPFKPNGRKPVYCKDCFARNEGGGESGSRPARDFNVTPKPFFKAPAPAGNDKRIDDLKVQLDSVNYKLEKLIKMLEVSKVEKAEAPKAVIAPAVKTETAKAEITKAPAKVVAKAEKPSAKKSSPKKK